VSRDYSYPRALLIGLTLATLAAVLVAGSTSSAAFGAYNPDWQGTSEFRALADGASGGVAVARSPERFGRADPNATVGVVVAPPSYTDAERAQFRRFVRGGGTLVVAADFGSGADPLLRAVGASARVDGRLVRDERYYYRGPALPVAPNVTEHSLTDGVDALTLNYGTALRPGESTVLVRTSPYAYLDDDRSGALDAGESLGRRPVATVERVGDGRVVVVGDPSLFINAMLERPGNRRFARALVADADTVLLAYGDPLPPLVATLVLFRRTPLLQGAIGLAALAAVALWTARPTRFARLRGRGDATGAATGPRLSESEIADVIQRRHPEWDAGRVERVAETINSRQYQKDNND
jgi:hypothetical protein